MRVLMVKKFNIIRNVLVGVVCYMILFISNTNVMAQDVCRSSIEVMVESIQKKEWDAFTSLMTVEEQEFYKWYFNEDAYTDGIKQIQEIELKHIYELEEGQLERELQYEEHMILSSTEQISGYLVELNCNVAEENIYFHNGINYYLVVFAKEGDGSFKIAQFNQPKYELLKEVVEPNLITDGDEAVEQKAAMEISHCAENGVLVGSDGSIIIDDDYVVWRKNKETGEMENYSQKVKEARKTRGNNYVDHPALDLYLYYSIPTNITVCLNQTGGSAIVSPTLDEYIKNTMPNEIYTSWNSEALIANAYCVKGVGIYRSIKPISSSYMVSQGTQKYVPNTANTTTNTIVDSISTSYIVNSAYQIFFPEYGAGTKDTAGTAGTARLLQYGTQYLADSLGYTYKEILDYYYANSDCSAGSIKYVSYPTVA